MLSLSTLLLDSCSAMWISLTEIARVIVRPDPSRQQRLSFSGFLSVLFCL